MTHPKTQLKLIKEPVAVHLALLRSSATFTKKERLEIKHKLFVIMSKQMAL